MDISIIICTYNRWVKLCDVLNDLDDMSVPPNLSYELIVVDNNCSDGTRAGVQARAQQNPKLRYSFEARQGLSKARNTGIRVSRGAIIAFTDDDVRIDKSWLVEMYRAFAAYGCMGVGGKIVPLWSGEKPWWYEDDGPYRLMAAILKLDLGDEACQLQSPAWGANMVFRRNAFDKYGLFREDLGRNGETLSSGEDTEFWWCLIRGGEKVIYAPKMIVYHPVEEKRTKQDYFKSWYFYYGKTLIRTEKEPLKGKCYFGVPRFLIRQLITDFSRWVLCTQPKRRFYYKLQIYQAAGAIAECRSYSRLRQQMDTSMRRLWRRITKFISRLMILFFRT